LLRIDLRAKSTAITGAPQSIRVAFDTTWSAAAPFVVESEEAAAAVPHSHKTMERSAPPVAKTVSSFDNEQHNMFDCPCN